MTYTVGVIVGSISAQSVNRQLATALERLAPRGIEFRPVAIDQVGHYNHDLDGDYPAEARALKDAIESADALLFVTPEYNRSIPGVLKNAIDWASRPWGTNSFAGKPAAIIGASIGPIGTAAGQQHLRQILAFVDARVMGQPEGFIHVTPGLLTDDGGVTNADTEAFLTSWMAAFDAHVRSHHRAAAAA